MAQPDFQFVTGDEQQFLIAPALRLAFRFAGAQWTHCLSVGARGWTFTIIAATVESDPTRDDPARVVSPVYQDVQPHFPEGQTCALLTGHSIPHHFSAVVTARREGACTVVEFDVADRCRAPMTILAATYLVRLGSSALMEAGTERIVWGGAELGQGRLEFTAGGGGTVALAEAGRQAVRVQALARLDSTTHTQRLLYSWRWSPAD
jgi:hypothetical protein